MKIENIIRRVLREQEEEKLSELPPFDDFFDSDWNLVLNFMNRYPNKKFYYPSDLDLTFSDIKTLGNLVKVEGDLDLWKRNIKSLGNLERVDGYLNLYGCKNLQSLGNLKYVGGLLYSDGNENLQSLGNLIRVEGNLDLRGSEIKTLGNLVRVGGDLDLRRCFNLQSLGNLEYVGGDLELKRTPLEEKYTEKQIRDMVEVVGVLDM
jgi:hypothetical protein